MFAMFDSPATHASKTSLPCSKRRVRLDVRRKAVADYMAAKFAESRREQKALPPVGPDVLTFARAKQLFFDLLSLQTSGHVQQFLIAAPLSVHRERHLIEVKTHHPHASDRFDNTVGDIEEHHDGRLIRAYEVTVRPDWKSRMSSFREKMDIAGLSKYVIIAGGVNRDDQLAQPAKLIAFLKDYERDIAVVDIEDFTNVFAAELTATELRKAINLAYDFLCRPKLSGKVEYQDAYRAVVDRWLDQHTLVPTPEIERPQPPSE